MEADPRQAAERGEQQVERLEERADERADSLEERADALGEQIDETRRDWERKKDDPDVPGAAGDPERAEGGAPPETDTTPGD